MRFYKNGHFPNPARYTRFNQYIIYFRVSGRVTAWCSSSGYTTVYHRTRSDVLAAQHNRVATLCAPRRAVASINIPIIHATLSNTARVVKRYLSRYRLRTFSHARLQIWPFYGISFLFIFFFYHSVSFPLPGNVRTLSRPFGCNVTYDVPAAIGTHA